VRTRPECSSREYRSLVKSGVRFGELDRQDVCVYHEALPDDSDPAVARVAVMHSYVVRS